MTLALRRALAALVLVALVLPSCGDDEPLAPSGPTASFQVTPPSGSRDTDFVVDASGSRDPDDPVSSLQVRWNWEDDATWDTDWMVDKTATHRYPTVGNWTIRLEVRNTSGETAQTTLEVEVQNLAPETEIDSVATSLKTGYDVWIRWTGFDPDGQVVGFLVGWDDPNALELVAVSDRGFTLPPTLGEHTFYCAAQDAEGRADPTPASLAINVPHSFLNSQTDVVDALALAYRTQDFDLFPLLLANDPNRNAEFLFLLSEPTETGETQWAYETEVRLHRRMFLPHDPGDQPVPNDLWLEAVDITLTALTDFSERTDLYSNDGGMDGRLDPIEWRAESALYSTNVFFAMVGQTDYQVHGQADFVIIEELTKDMGDAGRFLLFIWEDLGSPGLSKASRTSSTGTTWSGVKALYLPF